MKKIIRPELQNNIIGRFNNSGVWVECAKDPKTHNIVAVTLECPDDYDPASSTGETFANMVRWYGDGYSVQGEATRSKHFELFVEKVFRIGTWDGYDITKENLVEMLNNYQSMVLNGNNRIPIVLNHEGSDDVKRKVGYIEGLEIAGDYLKPLLFVLTTEEAIESVLDGTWDCISPFVIKDFVFETGGEPVHCKGWTLYDLAIVVHPRDFQLSLKFSAKKISNEVKMKPELKDGVNGLDNKANGTDGTESPDKNKTPIIPGTNDSGTGNDPGVGTKNGTDGISFSDAMTEVRTLRLENQKLKGEKLTMSDSMGKLTNTVTVLEEERNQRKADDAIVKLEMSGHLPPAQHDKWVEHYIKMSDEMQASWVTLMEEGPKVIEFGRKAPETKEQGELLKADIKAVHEKYYGKDGE